MINTISLQVKLNKVVKGIQDEISFTPMQIKSKIQSTGLEVAQLLTSSNEENHAYYLCNTKLSYLLEKESKKMDMNYTCVETNIPFATRTSLVSDTCVQVSDEVSETINDTYIKIFTKVIENKLHSKEIFVFEHLDNTISLHSFISLYSMLMNHQQRLLTYVSAIYLDCIKEMNTEILVLDNQIIVEHAKLHKREMIDIHTYIQMYLCSYANTIVYIKSENQIELYDNTTHLVAVYEEMECSASIQKSYLLCALAQCMKRDLKPHQIIHYALCMNIASHLSRSIVKPNQDTLHKIGNEIKLIEY